MTSTRKPDQPFYDLFCGSCNVVSRVLGGRRYANDLHADLVALFQYMQTGGDVPSTLTEQEYQAARTGQPWLRAFAGFGCSFGGKFFGGYARGSERRNYASNARNSLRNKMGTLQDVVFSAGPYSGVALEPESLLYCDIPYRNTTSYAVGPFNHPAFYEWAEKRAAEGHTVLVSEYEHNVPPGWCVVWRHESKQDMHSASGKQKTVEVLMTPGCTNVSA